MDREFNVETNESSGESVASADASCDPPAQPVDADRRESNDNGGGINGGVRMRRRSLMERRNENSDNNFADLPRLSIVSSAMTNGGAILNPEEAEDETVQVFENFVLMEIQEEHLATPEGFPSRPASTPVQTGTTGSSFDMQPHNYQTVAARLDEIARWLENRRRVRDEADMAHWGNITQEAFCTLLNHFIDNGINLESIVQIFRFTRYVLIQYIKDNKKELFRKIMSWAVQFILQRISTWVREHGGWNRVLMTSYNFFCQYGVAVSIVLGVCLIAGVILWRKYC